MLMRYEDLVERQKQITKFTITREIQRVGLYFVNLLPIFS